MHTIDSDVWVSRSLRLLGEHSQGEIDTVAAILARLTPTRPEGLTIIDAGAYIGDMTIPFSRIASRVYAFEPQPEIREILQANLALNSCTNVEVFPYALGHENKEISFTAGSDLSPGSQTLLLDSSGATRVEMRTLDSLDLHPTLLKADVEGMEFLTLVGAQQTLAKDRPFLFLETDTCEIEGAPPWDIVMRDFRYEAHKIITPFWRPNNFNGVGTDPFANTASFMLLGVPLVPIVNIQFQVAT